MSHKNNISKSKEQNAESGSVSVRVVDVSGEGLETAVDGVSDRVSEVASEKISEQGGASGKVQKDNKNVKAEQKAHLEEHLLLRERLLSVAPKAPVMRREVKAVLEERKLRAEKDVRKYSRGQNYELLNKAIAELRHLVHQIQIVSHASYEILKEIWLRVVHKFA